MLWFLRDYPLAALLLRAATLAFVSLLIGGLFFSAVLVPPLPSGVAAENFSARALRLLRLSAVGLAVTQLCFVSLDSAMLIGAGGLHLSDLYTANYFIAALLLILTPALFLLFTRSRLPSGPGWLIFATPLLFATVWTSHSASRLEDRSLLMILTGLHQLATALWIGGMPWLWLSIGTGCATPETPPANDRLARTVRRYSMTALVSVIVLLLAGVGMAWFYTQSWSAVYGTAYGIVLLAKSVMLAALLLLGAANFVLIRKGRLKLPPSLLRIAKFSEVEIGIGFTIILAAASLTAQPPAVDLVQNRLTLGEIAARMTPIVPSLKTPPVSALPAVQSMGQSIRQYAMSPDDARSANNRFEQQWSEYNHHWAGIIVFAAGFLALLGRWKHARWARNWPLVFLGLAIFLFFRADPEAWPLGPRGFWDSFYNPEDLEHRLYILLILSFVGFEWSVQTYRLISPRAALVFPAVCALGGALLLTHTHALGNVKEELLTEMSHTAIALCAIFAGWSRWLELRTAGKGSQRVRLAAAWIWPICFMLIGSILLNYRES